jgi:hypothetical protein
VLQAFGGTVHWAQLPTYVLAEIAAGVAAGLTYTLVSRSRPTRSVDIRTGDIVRASRAAEPVA